MTKYLFQTPDGDDRVLCVRRWYGNAWIVGSLPVDPRKRFYPNLDFDTARGFYGADLTACFTEKAMQRKLDAYAKKYGLAVWEEEQ